MQLLDIVCIILIGLLVLRGFLKGFTGEFFFIASLALALSTAILFYKPGAHFLRSRYLQMALLPEILSFLAILVTVFFLSKIIERIVKDIINHLGLETLDKALGGILGLAESFAIIIILLFFLTTQPFFDPVPLIGESIFARFFLPFVEVLHV